MSAENNNSNNQAGAIDRPGQQPPQTDNLLNISLNSSQIGNSFVEKITRFRNVIQFNFSELTKEIVNVKSSDKALVEDLNKGFKNLWDTIKELQDFCKLLQKNIDENYDKLIKDINTFLVPDYEQRFSTTNERLTRIENMVNRVSNVNVSVIGGNPNELSFLGNNNNNLINQGGNANIINNLINDSVVVADNVRGDYVADNNNSAKVYVIVHCDEGGFKFSQYVNQPTQLSLGEHKVFFKKVVNSQTGNFAFEAIPNWCNVNFADYISRLMSEIRKVGKSRNKYSHFKSHDYVYKIKFNSQQLIFEKQVNRGENVSKGFYFGKISDQEKYLIQDVDFWKKKFRKGKGKNNRKNNYRNNNYRNNNNRNFNNNYRYNNNNGNYNNNNYRNYNNGNFRRNNGISFGKMLDAFRRVMDEKYDSRPIRGGGSFRGRRY